jgi:formate-dependent nitrite reductase membrane component NrfD
MFIGLYFLLPIIQALRLLGVSAPLISTLSNSVTTVFIYWFFGIGISQLFYVIPLTNWFVRQRRMGMVKGIVIAALLTILVNGSCYYIVWFSGR